MQPCDLLLGSRHNTASLSHLHLRSEQFFMKHNAKGQWHLHKSKGNKVKSAHPKIKMTS